MNFNSTNSFFHSAFIDRCETAVRIVFQHEYHDGRFLVVKFVSVSGKWEPLNMKIWKGSLSLTLKHWNTNQLLDIPAASMDSIVKQAREFASDLVSHWFINETFVDD